MCEYLSVFQLLLLMMCIQIMCSSKSLLYQNTRPKVVCFYLLSRRRILLTRMIFENDERVGTRSNHRDHYYVFSCCIQNLFSSSHNNKISIFWVRECILPSPPSNRPAHTHTHTFIHFRLHRFCSISSWMARKFGKQRDKKPWSFLSI